MDIRFRSRALIAFQRKTVLVYRIAIALCTSAIFLAVFGWPARATTYVPSVRIGTAALITPTSANNWYNNHDNGVTPASGPIPPELTALAASLNSDSTKTVDRIYQYVHNNIQTVWMYGLQKGALGAEIDKSGTPFDQAQLMIALLSLNGISASYVVGTVTLSGTQFSAWTNITSAVAACQLLSSGGIPATINGAGATSDCSTFSGNVSTVTMSHIWVSVVIPGVCDGATPCLFDPSYKTYSWRQGIDLYGAMQFAHGTPFADVTDTMQKGSLSNHTPYINTLDDAKLDTDLHDYAEHLSTYMGTHGLTGGHIEDIIGGKVLLPDFTQIRQTSLPYGSAVFQTWAANPTTHEYRVVHDVYRTTLRLLGHAMNLGTGAWDQMFDLTFFVDEIYGRRLTLDTDFNTSITETSYFWNDINLRLDCDPQQTNPSCPSLAHYRQNSPSQGVTARGTQGEIEFWANHPYAAASNGSTTPNGTYMDDYALKNVVLTTSLTIVHGWGDVGPGLLAKWSDEIAGDTPLPKKLYDTPCLDDPNEFCDQVFWQSTGNFARTKTAANWLAQYTRAAQLNGDIAKSIVQLHHALGVVYADTAPLQAEQGPVAGLYDFVLTDSYDRLDIDSALSVTSQSADPDDRRGAIRAIAASAATLEGSMSAQMADAPDTASTATRFAWGNNPPQNGTPAGGYQNMANLGPQNFLTFDSTHNDAASVMQTEGNHTVPPNCVSEPNWGDQPGICNYTGWQASVTDTISAFLAANSDFVITASQETFLGPGQRGGTITPIGNPGAVPTKYTNLLTKQRGGALVAARYDSNGEPLEIAHIITGLAETNGGLYETKGGGGGVQPDTQTTYDPGEAADVLKARFVDRSNLLGVNLSNGSLAYTSPVSLTVGNGGFPYQLSANLTWHAGAAPNPQFGPIPQNEPQAGWTSGWHNNLAVSGSGLEAMGQSDLYAAANSIAAFFVSQDIYKDAPGTVESAQETAGLLAQAWWATQLTENVLTVSVGGQTRQFLKTAYGSWTEPGSERATAAITHSRQQYEYICNPSPAYAPPYALSRGWDYNPAQGQVSFTVTNTHFDTQTFNYWLNEYPATTESTDHCGQLKGFRLTKWHFPQGEDINIAYNQSYNGFDLLSTVSNSGSRTLTYNYTTGLISSISNGTASIQVPFLDNAAPEIASMKDQLLKVTSFGYLPAQTTSDIQRPIPYPELSTVTTPEKTSFDVHYFYDALGRIDQVEDAIAVKYPGQRGPYDFFIADGTRGERDDPLGQPYTVDYDTYGHPARYTDEVGASTLASIDSRGLPISYLYPEGDCEVFAYDRYKNQTDLWHVDNSNANRRCDTTLGTAHVLHASADYDLDWNKPSDIFDFNGNETTFTYYGTTPGSCTGNGNSLPCVVTRPQIAEGVPQYKYEYSSHGKPTKVTDPDQIVTQNTYDGSDNLQTTTVDPGTGELNLATNFFYDAQGNTTKITDPRLIDTTFCYDLVRRKIETDHHDGQAAALLAAESVHYDEIGRDVEDDRATTTGAQCSGSNYGTSTWQMDKTTSYTLTSKVYQVTDADSKTTTNSYDDADRLYLVTDPLSRQTRFLFCSAADANCAANQVRIEYRGWTSGLGCSYPNSLQECYRQMTYGPNGEQATIEDANNNITTYCYDGFVRLIETDFPDSTGTLCQSASDYERLTLDSNGNIKQRRNRAGETLTYNYNTLNWITQKVSPNPAVTTGWTYKLNGRINVLSDTAGNSINYAYDTAGRESGVTTTIPGLGAEAVTYGLDQDGNRTHLTWPDGYDVGYCYDNLNRMAIALNRNSNCTGGQRLATYTYDPLSRRTSVTFNNGASMSYPTYSPAGDLMELDHDMDGTDNDPHYTFTYTDAHEIKTEANTKSAYVWQPSTTPGTTGYAAANNLNQYPSYTPPGISPGPRVLGYDAKGNLTSGNLDGSGAWGFGYDAENRMLSACKPYVSTSGNCPAPIVNAAYAYDPLGRRTHKSGTGVVATYFLDDGDDEIAEYDSGGNLTHHYVPGPAIDEPIATVNPGHTQYWYYHTNHQGSVIALSGASGVIQAGPYLYDAFGNCFVGSTPCSSSAATLAATFTGRRLDQETGLYYYRARCYSPTLGRFCQTDPVGYTADLNLYTYVGNDPIGKTDSMGLFPGDDVSADRVAQAELQMVQSAERVWLRSNIIFNEESLKWQGHHNDFGDAMRHAEASYEITKQEGAGVANILGSFHEFYESLFRGQPSEEMYMDLNNNAEGRAAATENRKIDPSKLITGAHPDKDYPGPNEKRYNQGTQGPPVAGATPGRASTSGGNPSSNGSGRSPLFGQTVRAQGTRICPRDSSGQVQSSC